MEGGEAIMLDESHLGRGSSILPICDQGGLIIDNAIGTLKTHGIIWDLGDLGLAIRRIRSYMSA